MVDLNAHEAGNGGQSQGKPTTRGVLLYSEREGPPLNVTWLEFRSVEGLHPPGIFNSNEKRILPFAAIRKRHHSGDWPVYGHLSATMMDDHNVSSRCGYCISLRSPSFRSSVRG